MSRHTERLREVIVQFNRVERAEVERFFTPELVLEYPTSGANRCGLAGARKGANPDSAAMIGVYRFVGGRSRLIGAALEPLTHGRSDISETAARRCV